MIGPCVNKISGCGSARWQPRSGSISRRGIVGEPRKIEERERARASISRIDRSMEEVVLFDFEKRIDHFHETQKVSLSTLEQVVNYSFYRLRRVWIGL